MGVSTRIPVNGGDGARGRTVGANMMMTSGVYGVSRKGFRATELFKCKQIIYFAKYNPRGQVAPDGTQKGGGKRNIG